jgi:hypothetical protein
MKTFRLYNNKYAKWALAAACFVVLVLALSWMFPADAFAEGPVVKPPEGFAFSDIFSLGGWVKIVSYFLYLILSVVSFILWLSAIVFNLVFDQTVIKMSAWVNDITVINRGWVLFRDLVNMMFIFILVYIAIRTIVDVSSHSVKQMLSRVIIAALLINFSLFFTKIMIDASNIVATEFYSSIIVNGKSLSQASDATGSGLNLDRGISGAYMQAFGLVTFYDSSGATTKQLSNIPKLGIGFFGTAIIMLIAAWSFLAAAFLLILRFATLILLMVTSPVAFLFGVVPAFRDIADRWWKALGSNLLFAPIYMILTWFVLMLINSGEFQSAIPKGGFAEVLSDDRGSAATVAGVFFNYFIAIVFMVMTIILAKTSGIQFAHKIVGATGRVPRAVAGFAGRHTVGWAGSKIRKGGEKLEEVGAKHNIAPLRLGGGVARRGGSALEERKYLGQQSRKQLEDRSKADLKATQARARVSDANRDIEDATKPGATPAQIDKAIKALESLSQADFRKVKIKTLSHPNLAPRLSRKLDSIERDTEMSDSDKETFMKAYSKPLEDAIRDERTTPGSGSPQIASYLKGRTGDAVAKLDPALLSSDEVIPHLEPAMLRAMMRTLDISQGPIIGAKIRTIPGNPRAVSYITRTPGSDFYS